MHLYVLGQTGTGKSTLFKNMALQDIQSENGCCVIDPHGDLITDILEKIPERSQEKVIVVRPANPNCPYRYNPLRFVSPQYRPLVTSGLLDVFRKLWTNAWGIRLEHILRNTILALLSRKDSTLAHIPQMINQEDFRQEILKTTTPKHVVSFWEDEFPRYSKGDILPILNKVGALLAHPAVERVLTFDGEQLYFRSAIMDTRKVILVDLSKGELGGDAAHVLGAVFVTAISNAAMSRASLKEGERKSFYLYLDEFHHFTTESVVDMMAELRKYKVGLNLAHQYLGQLKPSIRDSVLGNAGTKIVFRTGPEDAQFMARQMNPYLTAYDIHHLPNRQAYIQLMIHGTPSKPFSISTLTK
jgi:hypothetical protein